MADTITSVFCGAPPKTPSLRWFPVFKPLILAPPVAVQQICQTGYNWKGSWTEREQTGERNNETKTKVLIKAQWLMDNFELKGEKPIPQYARIWLRKLVQLLSG